MENKNIQYNTSSVNLLNNRDFISAIKFEADYANTVKGGHLPYYYSTEKKRRLVSDINLLSTSEQQDIIFSSFISQN